MMYLYLGKNSVKVLGMTKSLLGQYNVAHFAKTHSNEFFSDGTVKESDLIASAIKEALTQAQPQPISDKEAVLILPQELFTFGRYTIPTDISESAIIPFIKDKVRTDLKISFEDTYHDFTVNTKDGTSVVFFYAIDKSTFNGLKEILGLLQLKMTKIIPESLAYYTLFEKTLRTGKKENIMYGVYKQGKSFAYFFDTHGLLHNEKFYIDEDIKSGMKKLVEKFEGEGHKVNRLILSGSESTSVRQDLFTKDVGAWTNPLEKIIENFYKDYLKTILPNEKESLSIVQYDVCLGAYIFAEENKAFTLMQQPVSSGASRKLPRMKIGLSMGPVAEIFKLKTLVMFLISFILSFGIIYAWSQMNGGNLSLPSLPSFSSQQEEEPTEPTPEPTEVPTPTPSILREDLNVKILNGTGTPGQAGVVQDILLEAGYSDIVTDNADNYDYETTQVLLSEDAEDALSFIQEDLADYVDITDASTIEDEDETADVIIITGADFE